MERTLSEEEGKLLDEMMELAQVKNLQGLHRFVTEHCGESDIDFIDEKLRAMPVPNGKLRETFILVVNAFIKYARDHGTYPATPAVLSRMRVFTEVAAYYQTSTRTAGHKVQQLVALGWIEPVHGNIKNPIATWHSALETGKRHPGIIK